MPDQKREEAATKHDAEKPELAQLPDGPLRAISQVLMYGARTYHRNNWRKGMHWSRVVDALLRHVFAWNEGEDLDSESGLSHLAHAGCNLLFLLFYEQNRLGVDDRWTPDLLAKYQKLYKIEPED